MPQESQVDREAPPLNRTLAVVLAAIALILAILGAMLVLSADDPGPGVPTVRPQATTSRTEREHAQTETQRRPNKQEPAPPAIDPTPIPEPERLPAAAGHGFVRGTISDVVTGDVLRDAHVRLLHATGEEIATSGTDHAGHYALDDVPEGLALVLEISAPGHLTGLCCSLRLTPGEIARKNAALLRAPQIAVSLRAMPWERAARGVRVRLMDAGRELATGTTDEFGNVSIAAPEFGRFQLRVGGGGEWAPNPAEEVAILPGAGDLERRADVRRGGHLEILVTNGLGEARAEVGVTVFGKGLEAVVGVTSDEGRITLGPFPPGVPLRVIASADDGRQTATIAARARDRHDVDVPLVLRGARRIRGRITDESGRPVRRARVEVSLSGDGPLLGAVMTGDDGSFELTGVPDSRLLVRVTAAAFRDAAREAYTSDRGGSVRMRLERGPSGRLIAMVQGSDGEAVPDALVRVLPVDISGTTGKDGRVEIDGIPAGETQRVTVEAEGLRVQSAGAPDALSISLTTREKKRITITMVQAESAEEEPTAEIAATIRAVTGRIVRGTGAPVASARVWWSGIETVTAPDGTFRLERGPRSETIARPILLITPPAGLLEPLLLPLRTPDDNGLVDFANVGLRDRPSCIISLRSTPGVPGETLAFSLLYDGTDRLLGRSLRPFKGRTMVTYDGSWLHVATPGAWRSGGHRRAYVGVTGSTGPLVAWADWPVAAGPTMGVTPEWRDSLTKSVFRVPRTHAHGIAEFSLRQAPDGAPLLRMGLPTRFTLRLSGTKTVLAPFLRGVWDVVVKPAPGAGGTRLETTITDGRMKKLSPAR